MTINKAFEAFNLSSQSAEYALRWELQRRQREKDPLRAVISSLFGEQRRFVLSDAPLKTADCSRRAGKSHGIACYHYVCGCLRPGSTQLYLGLTRDSAETIMWPKLEEMNEQFGLKMQMQRSKLRCVIPETKSVIRLYGADQDKLANRLRGDAYGSVSVDEAQSFTSVLKYLIDEVLEPACIDYGGQIALTGTPGPVPAGLFYEACHGDEYEHFKWTLRDNPFLKNVDEVLKRLRKRRGWNEDHPTYLREYCGVWAYDPDSLVYRFAKSKNIESKPHKIGFEYAMGVDLGYNDAFTISIIGWHAEEKKAWICYQEKHVKTLPDFWAERIRAIQSRFDPVQTWCDAGALGKPIVEEMKTRYGLFLEPAEKTEKMAHIKIMNADFESGRLKVDPSLTDYVEQMLILKKDNTGTKEDPTLPNDLCDSALYAWRSSRHHWFEPPSLKPEYGSAEWAAIEEQAMLDAAIASHEKTTDNWLENE